MHECAPVCTLLMSPVDTARPGACSPSPEGRHSLLLSCQLPLLVQQPGPLPVQLVLGCLQPHLGSIKGCLRLADLVKLGHERERWGHVDYCVS